jgi:long-subunit fatty acid transport protein
LNNSLTTTSTESFNLKLGVIVKPIDWLSIGAAIHSPTQLTLTDKYSSSMTSDVDTNGTALSGSQDSPKGTFSYTVTTPWRAIGSVGFILKKIALVNVEYEYVDYSYAQLHSTPNVFSDVNNTIHNKYTATGNIRAGAEIRMDPFAFRIGYAYYGSPFKDGDNANANRMSYTTGVGYRHNKFFMDLAYVFTKYTEYNYLYDSANLPSVKNDYKASSFMVTVGVKF